MLKAIFNWFKKPAPEVSPEVKSDAVPYKVEAPVQVPLVMEAAPVATAKPASVKKTAAKPAAKKPAAITAKPKKATKKK